MEMRRFAKVLAGRTRPDCPGMVYAVAKGNILDDGTPFDWAAYILAVPDEGATHEQRIEMVTANGDKMPENLARALFPEFELFAWRR